MNMTTESSFECHKKRRTYVHKIINRYLKIIIFTLSVGTIICYCGWIFTPSNAYVICNDPTIQREYKRNTISVTCLLCVSLLGPLLQMTITEWSSDKRSPTKATLSRVFRKAYTFFIPLTVGCLFNFFLVELLKTGVSAPRPHFMNSCKPKFNDIRCDNKWLHVTYENCSNPFNFSYINLIDTMKSFPSGHASISVYAATFISMYMNRRKFLSWPSLLTPSLHLAWWTWALLCSASRIWDAMHHWRDVLFGMALGVVLGYFVVVYMCLDFNYEEVRKNSADDIEKNDQNKRNQPTRDSVSSSYE